MTKTIHFKEIPHLNYSSTGEDEENTKANYTLTFPKCIVGEVIPNPDFDDGTPDCEGTDDNEFTLVDPIAESEITRTYSGRKPDWNTVKTIHFDESCTVPRYKLGSFCKQKNLKVIRSAEKADLILYGPRFKRDLVNDTSDYFIKKNDLLRKASLFKSRKIPQDMLDSIKAHESDLVIIEGCEWLVPKKHQINGNYIKLEEEDTWKALTQDQKYCNQEVLLEDMGLEVIDEYTFSRLCQMFDSEDGENHRVAMEIMANCHYGKSIVYLLELMRRYYGDKMFNTHDRHHVSFKALRVYLSYEPRFTERALNDIITNVAERNLLTESNYKIILKLILTQEEKSMGKTGGDDFDNDNWRITQVDLSPKYKEMIIWDKKEEEVPVLEPQPDFTA